MRTVLGRRATVQGSATRSFLGSTSGRLQGRPLFFCSVSAVTASWRPAPA